MKNASDIFDDMPDGSELVDGTAYKGKCCGNCKHFACEDIYGVGWCYMHGLTCCDSDCEDHEWGGWK